MMNKAIIAAIVLVVVFLAGFVPQYVKVNHLDAELRQARQARDVGGASGLGGPRVRPGKPEELWHRRRDRHALFQPGARSGKSDPDANARKTYEDLLISRDKITAELAKGDPGVMGDLQDLFVRTRKATGASAEQ